MINNVFPARGTETQLSDFPQSQVYISGIGANSRSSLGLHGGRTPQIVGGGTEVGDQFPSCGPTTPVVKAHHGPRAITTMRQHLSLCRQMQGSRAMVIGHILRCIK